jgi:hypothetical protein
MLSTGNSREGHKDTQRRKNNEEFPEGTIFPLKKWLYDHGIAGNEPMKNLRQCRILYTSFDTPTPNATKLIKNIKKKNGGFQISALVHQEKIHLASRIDHRHGLIIFVSSALIN